MWEAGTPAHPMSPRQRGWTAPPPGRQGSSSPGAKVHPPTCYVCQMLHDLSTNWFGFKGEICCQTLSVISHRTSILATGRVPTAQDIEWSALFIVKPLLFKEVIDLVSSHTSHLLLPLCKSSNPTDPSHQISFPHPDNLGDLLRNCSEKALLTWFIGCFVLMHTTHMHIWQRLRQVLEVFQLSAPVRFFYSRANSQMVYPYTTFTLPNCPYMAEVLTISISDTM